MHSHTMLRNKRHEIEIPKKKRIIFLDIDGVIQPYNNQYRFDHDMQATVDYVCERYHDEIYRNMDIYDVNAAFYDWDDVAIGILRKMLYEMNAYIVFHTGWKEFNSLDQLRALFKIYDMDDRCFDICEKGDKVKTINKYLEKHGEEIESYVVIDDADFSEEFGHHYVKTSNYINPSNVLLAKCILRDRFIFTKENENKYEMSLKRKNQPNDLCFTAEIENVNHKKDDGENEYNIMVNIYPSTRHVSPEFYIIFIKYLRKELKENNDSIANIYTNLNNEEYVDFLDSNFMHARDISRNKDNKKWELLIYTNQRFGWF